MRQQPVAIDYIDRENFLRYGETIEVHRPDLGKAQRGEDEYRTLSRVPGTGWRIALYCVRARLTDSLYVCTSKRLLTPQHGTALLCVAPPGRPDNLQIFLLDRPVAVSADIPHGLLTLSAEAWVQVGESFEAHGEPVKLRKTLVPAGLWH